MPALVMPNVGEGVTEGTVTRWLKQVGDTVALDEPVVEIETDKAVVEIPSPFEGTLTKILVEEGVTVPIETVLAEFEAVGAAPKVGVAAESNDQRAEPAGVAVSRGSVAQQQTNGAAATDAVVPAFKRTRQFSPVVLKLAAEHDVDLALVRGTGIEGRVTRQDVLQYIENPVLNAKPPSEGAGVVGVEHRDAPAAANKAAAPKMQPVDSDISAPAPLTPTRRTIAARMLESHQTIPIAWMAIEADVTSLASLRERAKAEFLAREGVKLTYLPFFVQAIAGALKEHPAINATFSDAGITVHPRYDIGIAIATESGLVVPVVREAGERSIAGLVHEMDTLGEKARARKLTLEEMRGATFTIDNTGAFGSIISQPIVPVGQVAIITTEAIRRELRPIDDGFAVRSVMNLAISFDHRALDGAEVGAFMQDVRRALESLQPDQPVH